MRERPRDRERGGGGGASESDKEGTRDCSAILRDKADPEDVTGSARIGNLFAGKA